MDSIVTHPASYTCLLPLNYGILPGFAWDIVFVFAFAQCRSILIWKRVEAILHSEAPTLFLCTIYVHNCPLARTPRSYSGVPWPTFVNTPNILKLCVHQCAEFLKVCNLKREIKFINIIIAKDCLWKGSSF